MEFESYGHQSNQQSGALQLLVNVQRNTLCNTSNIYSRTWVSLLNRLMEDSSCALESIPELIPTLLSSVCVGFEGRFGYNPLFAIAGLGDPLCISGCCPSF